MKLIPSQHLSNQQVQTGLKLVIKDGLAAEAMTTLTDGAFLVAFALKMGASNFQIGLLAALPTLTNIFQLVAIWLLQRYNNRRLIAVICNFFARSPLLVIGVLPLFFTTGTSMAVLIFLLFFHYLFGSIAGASWNSWMKDLVPEKQLGSYFSHRSRLTQTLNVVLSLVLAFALDYIKQHFPQHEMFAYAMMFITGGLIGTVGIYLIAKTPEPQSHLAKENLVQLFSKPLKDRNFRSLLVFQSFWAFALNLATPFFTVYIMKVIGLPLSYIIGFGIVSQVSSIISIKMWGRYSDRFSNKSIISLAAPIYVACILFLSFTAMPEKESITLLLLTIFNVVSGFATSGINLALNNIGLKLAPKKESIVYISARNMTVAFVSALGPLFGGWMADFFTNRSLNWNIEWNGPNGKSFIHLLQLQNWNFLFIIGGLLALLALRLLKRVQEEGEVEKDLVVAEMRTNLKKKLKERTSREGILRLLTLPVTYPVSVKKRMEHRKVVLRRLEQINSFRAKAA